jgi:serine/threonine protein kinase
VTKEERDEFRKTSLVRKKNSLDKKEVTFDDFDILMVIGRGTFGKVFLAELKATK